MIFTFSILYKFLKPNVQKSINGWEKQMVTDGKILNPNVQKISNRDTTGIPLRLNSMLRFSGGDK